MKIVIVTGSSRGLGASTALECAKRGMGVVVTYNNNPEKAAEVVTAIVAVGGKAIALKLDVGNSQSFAHFRNAVSAQLKAIWGRDTFDFLVNNAGYGLYAPIAEVTEEQFDAFVGTEGIRLYFERFFVGYNTISRLLSLARLDDFAVICRVDFTGDFGHEIGTLKIRTNSAGLIERIDADLE